MGNRTFMTTLMFSSLLSTDSTTFYLTQTSLQIYRNAHKANQSVYLCFRCLSAVKRYPHSRLISGVRSGCHGLHIDLGRFAKVVNIAAGRTGSVLCACLAQLMTNTIFCLIALQCILQFTIASCTLKYYNTNPYRSARQHHIPQRRWPAEVLDFLHDYVEISMLSN